MTENQAPDDNFLGWVRNTLRDDCDEYERSSCVPAELKELDLDLSDLLHALRNATAILGRYEGGCFVVGGQTLDGFRLAIVVAPPSPKNRVRVVKVWRE